MMRVIFICLVSGLILFLILSPFFIKVQIECKSQFGICPAEIEGELKQFGGKNLFQARRKSFEYLEKNLLVADFSTQFKVPNTLAISLLVKKPEFAILDKSSGKVGLADKDGRIISVLSNSSLPTVIVTGQDLQVGDKVSTNNLFALKLMEGIWTMYQVGMGEIQDDSLVVELPGSIKVILPLEGDIEILLGEVRLVYGKVQSPEISGKYSQIDLRFKNPVLR